MIVTLGEYFSTTYTLMRRLIAKKAAQHACLHTALTDVCINCGAKRAPASGNLPILQEFDEGA